MRVLLGVLLLTLAGTAFAGEYRESPRNKQIAMQVQKAQAKASVEGSSLSAPTHYDNDPGAIAPNPSAHAPSAQCRYGWSVTGAGPVFGAGISASEWDEICGLWMAAQQTTGPARDEAAAAAYCLTMKKAKVHSPTCVDWEQGQGVAKVDMDKANPGSVRFGGVGSGGWN